MLDLQYNIIKSKHNKVNNNYYYFYILYIENQKYYSVNLQLQLKKS